jgi:quercetin dioxygenase-like cupin family protein
MDLIRTKPDSRPGSADNFTGTVWLDQVAVGAAHSKLRVDSVHFSPGARTAWHTHPNGQILHVVDGAGRVQAHDGRVQEIRAGDSVVIAPGERHWHGAAPQSFMTHLSILETDDQGNNAQWGEPVTEEEYLAAPG